MKQVGERPHQRGWLAAALHRLTATDNQLDAEALQSDLDRKGAEPVVTCERGQTVCISGRLTSVVHTPRQSLPTVEAELWDGSGTVLLVWLGRRRIAGIEPGRSLVARGRLATRAGEPIMYNPWYELQPAPR